MGGGPRLPELQTFLLGFGRRGETTVEFRVALGVSRHQLLEQGHVGTLLRCHVVDMCQIGIEGCVEAMIAEEKGEQEQGGKEIFVEGRRWKVE